ncbi:MAG: hypothetical protein ACKVWR_16605 [Acidimicrobiales bacterium]
MVSPSLPPGARYLELLGGADLSVLAVAAGRSAASDDEARAWFAADPSRVEAALNDDATFERLFGSAGLLAGPETVAAPEGALEQAELLARVSPFLVFAVAVNRGVIDLFTRQFIEERIGPHRRIPVFDTAGVREFCVDPWRRLFLVEHLASYTKVRSGPIWVQRGQRWQRRRFSELDPARLAGLLEVLPEEEHSGVYRRLGDLALFMTGVFPDHTARRAAHPIEVERLVRSLPAGSGGAPTRDELGALVGDRGIGGLLGYLGPRWYRAAASSAPLPGSRRLLSEVADGFDHARRFLTLVADRFLFPFRQQWA